MKATDILSGIEKTDPVAIVAVAVGGDGTMQALWSTVPLAELVLIHKFLGMAIDQELNRRFFPEPAKTPPPPPSGPKLYVPA